jgi:hypothetical protein
LFALFIVVLLSAPLYAQQTAGYTPHAEFFNAPLVGVWTSRSLHQHAGGEAVDVWHRVEIRADGQMVHDYFNVPPESGNPDPIERLFSTWSAGDYIDPDPNMGSYQVMRIAPYESHSLVDGTSDYRRMRGDFIPVYRRFILSEVNDQLALSEPFVLVVPFVDQLRSFPPEASFLNYARYAPTAAPSAVAPVRWGWLKAQGKIAP